MTFDGMFGPKQVRESINHSRIEVICLFYHIEVRTSFTFADMTNPQCQQLIVKQMTDACFREKAEDLLSDEENLIKFLSKSDLQANEEGEYNENDENNSFLRSSCHALY